MSSKLTRVLLVTDHVEPTPAVLDALCARATSGPTEVRVIVPNPAAAEWHPLHPERHARVAEAERALARTLPMVEASCGVKAEGLVAACHDPMDAIEESLREERFDEIMVAIARHGRLNRRLHLDLPHRLAHLHVPVTVIEDARRPATAAG